MSNKAHNKDGRSLIKQVETAIAANKKNWVITRGEFAVDPDYHVHPELLICESEEHGHFKLERRYVCPISSTLIVPATEFTPEFKLEFNGTIGLSQTCIADGYEPSSRISTGSSFGFSCWSLDESTALEIEVIALEYLKKNTHKLKDITFEDGRFSGSRNLEKTAFNDFRQTSDKILLNDLTKYFGMINFYFSVDSGYDGLKITKNSGESKDDCQFDDHTASQLFENNALTSNNI